MLFSGRHIFIILLSLAATTAAARQRGNWSGSISASGGSNFCPEYLNIAKFSNNTGEANAKVKYSSSAFSLEAFAGSSSSRLITNKYGATFNFVEGSEKLNMDLNFTDNAKFKFNTGLTATMNLSGSDRLTMYYRTIYSKDMPEKGGVNLNILNGDTTYSEEDAINKVGTHEAGAAWNHVFDKSGRSMQTSFDFRFKKDDRYSEWEKGAGSIDLKDLEKTSFLEDESKFQKYRITPLYLENNYSLQASYKDKDFGGVPSLDANFSLNARINRERDYFTAANWEKEQWRDSLRYREAFEYIAIVLDPGFHFDWTHGRFDAHLDFVAEYYSDRINDDTHSGAFSKSRIDPLVNVALGWKPSDGHRLGMSLKRTITRPEYLQRCWFQRQGAYQNELQEGNTELLPAQTYRLAITYDYVYKRFSSTLELGHTYVNDKIEKTFSNKTVGNMDYRIYTWINGGESGSSNAILTARWKARCVKAELSGKWNYFVGWSATGKETRNSDYSINGNVSYQIPSIQLSFSAKGRYQSKIIRTYSSMTEYVGVDFRVEKKFKKIGLFTEGRDLFDKGIQTTTISEDMNHGRIEEVNYSRRLYLLGVSLNF